MVDDYSRERLAIEVDTALSGARVSRVLDRLVTRRGRPLRIMVDNSSESTSRALDQWAYESGVSLSFIRLQQAHHIENCFVKSLNGKFRDDASTKAGYQPARLASEDRGLAEGLQPGAPSQLAGRCATGGVCEVGAPVADDLRTS